MLLRVNDFLSIVLLMAVFFQIFALFALMAVGYALARFGVVEQGAVKGMSALIVKATLPALIVMSMQKPFSGELFGEAMVTLAVATLFYAGIIGLSLAAAALLRVDRQRAGAFAFALSFSNCAFVGFPVVESILGADALFLTSIHNILFNVLAFSAGILIMSGGSSTGGRRSAGENCRGMSAPGAELVGRGSAGAPDSAGAPGESVGREIVSRPGASAAREAGRDGKVPRAMLNSARGSAGAPGELVGRGSAGGGGGVSLAKLFNINVIAAIAGFVLFLFSVKIPEILAIPMRMIGGLTTPLAMVVTGAMLARTPIRSVVGDWRLYAVSALRLLVWPAITAVVLRLFGVSGQLYAITVIVAAMPSASNTSMIAEVYGGDTGTASSIVFMTTLFSVITIPLLAILLV
jgi:predicted permease